MRIRFDLFVALLLLLVTLIPHAAAARPERIKPGISYYSDDFVSDGLVRDLAEEKNYEEVYQFYSYYEAIYDSSRRVVVFREYKRGEVIRSEEYRYGAKGELVERRVTPADRS